MSGSSVPSIVPRTSRTAVSGSSFCAAISARASSGPSSRHHVSAIQSGYECRSAASRAVVSGRRLEERPGAVGELPQDRVRERDGALEPRAAHELDGLVDGCVPRYAVEVGQLVRAEAERGAHRRVELADRPPPERLDRVVEGPGALDRPVGEAPRERAIPLVEPGRLGAQRAIGVGAPPRRRAVRR